MTRFDFTNRDGNKLTGKIELPKGTPRSFAIFAHCFTCSRNAKAATQVSRALAELGIAVLRFDFTGLGNSEGDFANSNFSTNVNDLLDAATALAEQYSSPSLLVGHSLGGAAVLVAAAQIESVRAVATIGAPSEPSHLEQLIDKSTTKSHTDGSITFSLGGRELTIGSDFVSDLRNDAIAMSLPSLRKPLMIFHSPIDLVVSVENARKLYETAKHPKSFVSLDGADHMLGKPGDAEFVAGVLAAWASRYLPLNSAEETTRKESVSDGTVIVRELNGSLTQEVQTSHHNFNADEPIGQGGDDTGPNPYELLLAALGACTSMTLRMYARHKKLPLESIEVTLKHSRLHAEDCATCETKNGKIDLIEKEIVVGGDLTQEQVTRLGEIADRCPVHRTLMNEKVIESKVKHGSS